MDVLERSKRRGERVLECFILQGCADEKFLNGRRSCEVIYDTLRALHVELGGLVTARPKIEDFEVGRRQYCTP